MAGRRSYKLKSYLNASHAMRWKDGEGERHNHTYEINCQVVVEEKGMIRFDIVEGVIGRVVDQLSGAFLNEIPPFDEIEPSLENLTEYLFKTIGEQLTENNCKLVHLEVGESPTRFYCIDAE